MGIKSKMFIITEKRIIRRYEFNKCMQPPPCRKYGTKNRFCFARLQKWPLATTIDFIRMMSINKLNK